ncbi:MAG: D-glycero-beta-D-manno-heptose 1-phosphate adenylyltransferase [Pseudomonadota bacterium]
MSGWSLQFSRPLVFTNGCFDILHRGHVDYLERAGDLGKSLIVGVNSDTSVKELEKGENRPVNSEQDRAAILCALECVSGVVIFNEPTPLEIITAINPNVLVKGGDWSLDNIVGAREVTANGGEVRSIPFEFELSTSALIERIRSH